MKDTWNFKRCMSLLLAAVMVLGLLPGPAMAAPSGAPVSTAEEFAAMDPAGNYYLAADLEITAPYPSFSGNFDGCGHKVTLNLEGTGNQALFASLATDAVVENVVTAGTVNGNKKAGGIAGMVTAATIRNCRNDASITAKSQSGGIAGYLTADAVVENCYNTGSITGSDTQCGGIVGYINRGTVSNSYNVGTVTASGADANRMGGICGWSKIELLTNCFYLDTSAPCATTYYDSSVGGDKNDTAGSMTEDQMKEPGFAAELGNAFKAQAGSYPSLTWEIPRAVVPFSLTPEDAALIIYDASLEEVHTSDQGADRIVALAAGSYTYEVSKAGWTTAGGSFEITSEQAENGEQLPVLTVTLDSDSAQWSTVTFLLTPADAAVTVEQDGVAIQPDSGAYRLLKNRDFTYTVSASEEYEPLTATLQTADEACTVEAVLKKVESIVLGGSYKTDYSQGDSLLTDGMIVTVTYSDGSTDSVASSDFETRGVIISGFDTTEPATSQTVTVSYRGAQTTYTVNIAEKLYPSNVFSGLKGYVSPADGVVYDHNSGFHGEAGQEFLDDAATGSLKSQSAGMGSSQVTLTITLVPDAPQCQMSFDYKVSSESSSWGSVYDGIQINGGSKIGGEVDWTTYSASMNAGESLTITYIKDYSGNSGDDCVYLKNFQVHPLYQVTFTGLPEGAELELKSGDQVQTAETDGVYLLKPGTYSYTAAKFGYETVTGTVTVTDQNQAVTVTMEPVSSHEVLFDITLPQGVTGDSTITVKQNNETVYTGNGTGCTLPMGTYTYIVSHPLCTEQTGSLTVGNEGGSLSLTMERKLVFSDFFDGIQGMTAENDSDAPFEAVGTVGGTDNYLQSSNQGWKSTGTVTLQFTEGAMLGFRYYTSCAGGYANDYGMIISKNESTIDTISGDHDWTDYRITVAAGDKVTIQYKDYDDSGFDNLIRLKDFTAVPVYNVNFTLESSGAKLVLRQGEQVITPIEGTAYILPNGEYTYEVTRFGFRPMTGSLTVNGADQTVQIPALEALSVNKLTVTPEPADADVVVTHAREGVMEPEEDGSYLLPQGEEYSYSVSRADYVPVQGSLCLTEDTELKVKLVYAGEAWNGQDRSEPQAGTGTPEDPYEIRNGNNLAWFADQVNDGQTSLCAKLTDQINLNNQTWNAIGTYSEPYQGTFDGCGKTISGLKGVMGLFDTVGNTGKILNTTVYGEIEGSGNVGGIAGTLSGTVENCLFSGSVTNSASYSTGGIAGRMQTGSQMSGCVNMGKIHNTVTSYNSSLNTGGLAGYTYGTVESSYNLGTVSAREDRATNTAIGGCFGAIRDKAAVKNVYNAGQVSGPADGIAAFAGLNEGTVVNCYFLKGSAPEAVSQNQGTVAPEITEKTGEEMKTDRFAYDLGELYHVDENGGFPVLSWQGGRKPVIATDAELLAKDKAALVLTDTEEKLPVPDAEGIYQVTEPLTLVLPSVGENGTSIEWACMPEEQTVLNLSTGVLTIPADGKTELKLTANLTKGAERDAVTYQLTVWSQKAQDQEYLEAIRQELIETSTFIQPLQCYNHTNMTQVMEQWLMRRDYAVKTDPEESGIEVTFVNRGEKALPAGETQYISENGDITYYTAPQGFSGMNYAIYRDVAFRLTIGEASVEVKVQAHIGWDYEFVEERLDAAVETITWDTIRGENENTASMSRGSSEWYDTVTVDGQISKNLILPYHLEEYGDVEVQWASQNNEALVLEDNMDGTYTAVLNRPPYGAEPCTFTMTAITTFNRIDDYTREEATVDGEEQDWVTGLRNFIITLAPNDTDQSVQINTALENYPELISDFVNKDQSVDMTQVTADLQMPVPSDLASAGILPDRYNQKVTMVSSDDSVLEFNGYHGVVYRPLPGSEPAEVEYTITVYDRRNNATLGQKTFAMTVLPLTEEEIQEAADFMDLASSTESYWNGIRGENTDPDNVTQDMENFSEIHFENGQIQYVRGAINMTFGGIEVDDLPEYDPMAAQPWREFRTSRPTVVECEVLRVHPQEYDTQVTIDSVLTHSEFGKYWEKFGGDPDYEQFQQFYQRPVSVDITVKGTQGGQNPNPQEDLTVTVNVDGSGFEDFQNTTYTFIGTGDQDWTAWDALEEAMIEEGYHYAGSGTYISSVMDPAGTELAEMEHGPYSGWMYSLADDPEPAVSLNQYYLQNGDVLTFYYIGDDTPIVDGSLIQPQAWTSHGTADVDVTEEQIIQAAAAAQEELQHTVVIRPRPNEPAETIRAEIPAGALEALKEDGNLLLTLDSGSAQMTLTPEAQAELRELAQESVVLSVTTDKNAEEIPTVTVTVYADDQIVTQLHGIKVQIKQAGQGDTAVLVHRDGTHSVIRKSLVQDGIAYVLLDAPGSIKVIQNAKDFTDTDGHWGEASIAFASGRELMCGMTEERFAPDRVMDRAMMVTVLYRLEDETSSESMNSFPDVVKGSYYEKAAAWACKNQIIRGFNDGKFRPKAPVTREQMAVMLFRYAEYLGMDTSDRGNLNSFKDGKQISAWAADAMSWAVGTGIFQGMTENTLEPQGTATRAQIAEVLMRMTELLVK